MSSASKQLVFNTRERAVSDDLNRLQAFLGADAAEVARQWLLSESFGESDRADGVSTTFASAMAPAKAVILNGLMVRPPVSPGTELTVDPGVMWIIDPDGTPSPDDSPAKLCIDPGWSAPGLTFVSNIGTSGPVIAIIECQRSVTVPESQNRDVFDGGSGVFAPALVPKVKRNGLVYRIRRGIPASNFPAPATGWVPLAVAVVSNASDCTDWSQCDFWDVRPLITDRTRGPHNVTDYAPRWYAEGAVKRVTSTPLLDVIYGRFESTFRGARAGGIIALSSSSFGGGPSAPLGLQPLAAPDLTAADPAGLTYLYAMFPGGLPRWVKYKQGSDVRMAPGGFHGVPVLSTIPPNALGKPTASITAPAASNILYNTQDAVALVALDAQVTSGVASLFPMMADGQWVYNFARNGWRTIHATVTSPTSFQFAIRDNLAIPPMAKAIRARIEIFTTGGSGNQVPRFYISDGDPRGIFVFEIFMSCTFDLTEQLVVEIPLSFAEESPSPRTVTLYCDQLFGVTVIQATLITIAYRL